MYEPNPSDMNSKNNLEEDLSHALDAKPSASFVHQLEGRLQGQFSNRRQAWSFSFFRFITVSGLVLAILAVSLLPHFGEDTLSAQAFIEAAYAKYENEDTLSGVYYQKTLYSDPKGELETIIEEWTDKKGDRIYTEWDAQGKEQYNFMMTLIGDNNELDWYFKPEEDPFSEGSLFCVGPWEEVEGIKEREVLQVAKKDYTTASFYIDAQRNTAEQSAEEPAVYVPTEGEQELNDLELAKTNSQEAKTILETLKADPNVQYEEVKEDGKKYLLFIVPLYFNLDDDMYYYFNAETYRLERQERYERSNGNPLAFRLDYLESYYLTDEEAEGIFDPERYGAVKQKELFESSVPESIQEEGCYGSDEQLLTAAEERQMWDSLPEDIRKTFLERKMWEQIPVYEEGAALGEALQLDDLSLEAYVRLISDPEGAKVHQTVKAPSSYEITAAFETPRDYVHLTRETYFVNIYQWKDPTSALFYLQTTELDLDCLPSEACTLTERWYGPFVGEE